MCRLCRQEPCDPRCPDAPRTVYYRCGVCGEEIETPDGYALLGKRVCEACVDRAFRSFDG